MQKVKILETEDLNKEIKRIRVEKPKGFVYHPGQSIEISHDSQDWQDKKRPFSFISIPSDDYLEFAIKAHTDIGFSKFVHSLKKGDEIIFVDEPYGRYKFLGEGTFIAGGVGITPIISIVRSLKKADLSNSKCIYSASSKNEFLFLKELKEKFGKNLITNITNKNPEKRISKEYLEKNLNENDLKKRFYVCGPGIFRKQACAMLEELGVNKDKIQG
ncbi:MAG: flavodoxin reductase [Nanoarchaeota archaeon]|nr:flavodoxin reductase [Nanoarchaeota archaeon]